MCIDGQPLDMIQQLLEVAVGDLGLSPKDIVQCAIEKIVCILRYVHCHNRVQNSVFWVWIW